MCTCARAGIASALPSVEYLWLTVADDVQLHLVLEAAAVVRNHNQHRCCSLVFIKEPSQREPTTPPSLATLKVAPQHLHYLHGRDTDASESLAVQISISDALPTLLNLGSQECGPRSSAPLPSCTTSK